MIDRRCRSHVVSCCRYLQNGFGSGQLVYGGYYTTTVDPSSDDFTIVVVKISYDHAPCTRPKLPETLSRVEPETVTFQLDVASLGGNVSSLAVWRSNFEMETPLLFAQQDDVAVTPSGEITLQVAVGDCITMSTVRTARHGAFPDAPVPPSVPQFPLPYATDFEDASPPAQPKYANHTVVLA